MSSISSIFHLSSASRMSNEEVATDLTQKILSKDRFDKAAATKLLRLCGDGRNEMLNRLLLQVERQFPDELWTMIGRHGSRSLCDAIEDARKQRLEKYGIKDCTSVELVRYSPVDDSTGKAACKELVARLCDPNQSSNIASKITTMYLWAANKVEGKIHQPHVLDNLEKAALEIIAERNPELAEKCRVMDAAFVLLHLLAPYLDNNEKTVFSKYVDDRLGPSFSLDRHTAKQIERLFSNV